MFHILFKLNLLFLIFFNSFNFIKGWICGTGKHTCLLLCCDCDPGKYSDGISTTCKDCPAGRYGLGNSHTNQCDGPCPGSSKGTSICDDMKITKEVQLVNLIETANGKRYKKKYYAVIEKDIQLTESQGFLKDKTALIIDGAEIKIMSGNPQKKMKLEGKGLDYVNYFRILWIKGYSKVQLENLIITKGYHAGVVHQGHGGGIFVNRGSHVTITSCEITGNEASQKVVIASSGGGLYNFGTVTMISCTVHDNMAHGSMSYGGGIFNAGMLNLTNCTIFGNRADKGTSGGYAGPGKLTMDVYTRIFNNTPELHNCNYGQYRSIAMFCLPCMGGWYQPNKNMGGCYKCPSGTYSQDRWWDETTGGTHCITCSAGRYGIGGSINSNCTGPCPPGKYSIKESSECKDCPAGSYSLSGQGNSSNCTSCPAGSYAIKGKGMTNDCYACPSGTYSLKGMGENASCTSCPKGTYSQEQRLVDISLCVSCDKGTYADEKGLSKCKPCLQGKYNDKTRATTIEMCKKCPNNTYSSIIGLDNKSKCNLCPPGRSSILFGLESADDCAPVSMGKYGDPYGKVIDCPRGKYQNEYGSTSCKDCSSGSYNNKTGQIFCANLCKAGKYSLAGSSFCLNCPAGRNSKLGGLKSKDECAPVPVGKYASGEGNTIDCPPGQYQDQNGSTFCKLCVAGKYNDKNGQISCPYTCPIGKFSFKGSLKCQKCPGGYKGIKSQAISLDDGCTKCPNGTYSNDDGGHTTCTTCNREGYFCPEGAIKEELCTSDEYCDGKTKQKRPIKPINVIAKKIENENTINVTWEMNWNKITKGGFDIYYSTNKDISTSKMNLIMFDIEDLNKKLYSFKINNLNVGTKYFVKVISVQYITEITFAKSQPSEWSAGVEIPCPKGAYCGISNSEGVSKVNTKNLNGYYKTQNNTFVECNVISNCPGIKIQDNGTLKLPNNTLNQCPKGYNGILCLKCESNYTRQGDNCNLCSSVGSQIGFMFLALVAGISFFAYLIYKQIKSKGNPKKVSSGIIKITMRLFQLSGIISQFPLTWSDDIITLFSSLNVISNAGSSAFSIDCFIKSSYIVNSILNLVMPLLILVFFLSITYCYYQGRNNKCKSYMILISFVILISLHPSLVKLVLNFFQCTKSILGSKYLIADVDIKCWSSEHNTLLLGLGLPATILYILGIPLIAGISIYINRNELNQPEIREKIGFLYADYESKYYLWEIIIILRLVAMSTINVIFEGNPHLQSILGLQILFLSILLHMTFRPYIENDLDQIETNSLATSILCLSCGALLINENIPKEWKIMATIMIFISISTFIIHVIYKLYQAYKDDVKNTIRKDLQIIKNQVSDVKHNILQMVHLAKRNDNDIKKKDSNIESNDIKNNPLHEKKNEKHLLAMKKENVHSINPKINKNEKLKNDEIIIHNENDSNSSSNWIKYIDDESGNLYWYNEKTNITTWDNPN